MDYLANDHQALLQCSVASRMVRQATLPILFRTLRIDTGYRHTYSTPVLLERLDDMGYLTRYITHLAMVPLDKDGRWVNPKYTVMTPCVIYRLLRQVPNVRTVDLVCFTLKKCTKAHVCEGPPTPKHFERIAMQHVRVKGSLDPCCLLNIAATTSTFVLSDVLTTERVVNTAPAPLFNGNLCTFTYDILMDTLWAKDNGGGRTREQRYDTFRLARANIEGCESLARLKLAWYISDKARGTSIKA